MNYIIFGKRGKKIDDTRNVDSKVCQTVSSEIHKQMNYILYMCVCCGIFDVKQLNASTRPDPFIHFQWKCAARLLYAEISIHCVVFVCVCSI